MATYTLTRKNKSNGPLRSLAEIRKYAKELAEYASPGNQKSQTP